MNFFLSLIVIALLICLAFLYDRRFRYRHISGIPGRENLALDDLYNKSYKNDNDVCFAAFKMAFENVSRIFHVPVGSIRKTDRFGNELGKPSPLILGFDSIELEDFYLFVDEKMKTFDMEEYEINVVDDYVKFEAQIQLIQSKSRDLA